MASEILEYQRTGDIAIVSIDSPPVNALGIDVRRAIVKGIEQAIDDKDVKAVILMCAGKTFHAGADIREFGQPPLMPSLRQVIDTVESVEKLCVAAIHGTALGGGLELALGCHRRIAVSTAKVGLPEVNLGILPGAGGTQKLPRLIGAEKSLELICSGRMVGADEALALGIIDELTQGEDLRSEAIAYTKTVLASGEAALRARDLTKHRQQDRKATTIFSDFRKAKERKFRGFKAPQNIIKSIENAVQLPFKEGMLRERELFEELVHGTQSTAQRHVFFAARESSKIPDIPKSTPVRPVAEVAVIGAGTMGGGITMNFLNAGFTVVLMEQKQQALDRGIKVIRGNYERSLKRGKLSEQQVDERMALIRPTLEIEDLRHADLIIEAVFEEMSIKKQIFTELDQIAKSGAILASNTSYLDLDEIAAVTSRPEDVIGMHFFSPANVMQLLEVVRGEKSSLDAINTAIRLAKTINKVPVLSRVGYGFIANRVMKVRATQAISTMLAGISPERIDQVIYDYGFAMGPFAMRDLVGLDVINRGSTEKTVDSELVRLGRLGQKQNGGYYDYDEKRQRTISPIALDLIASVAAEKGIEQISCSDEEIMARLLFPVVNEGARVLDEGIAIRSSDIDIACIKGYNWPSYHGGPMCWANTIGLDKVYQGLQTLEQRYGDDFAPSPLLIRLAEQGQSF